MDSDTIFHGTHGYLMVTELERAADEMKELVEHFLEIEFADTYDLSAHLSNAAILLRLCDRHADSEALLIRGIPRAGDEPQLRRLLALAQSAQDRDVDALTTLAGDTDAENQLFRAELQASTSDVSGALRALLEVDPRHLPEHLHKARWHLMGEMSLDVGDRANLAAAIEGLRTIDPLDIRSSILEIRWREKTSESEESIQEQLRRLVESLPSDLDMASRLYLAKELRRQDLPDEASRLLDNHVNLSQLSPAATLYLQSLAQARRDDAFRAALANATPEIRSEPATLWVVAQHAWNLGDLDGSMAAVRALLAQRPDEPKARLLKIEILIRRDQSKELLAELDKPLETLKWQRTEDQFRGASLLGHFGFEERAADLAYKLFIEHRDLSRAWMTLSVLVLDLGRGRRNAPGSWNATEVGPNSAVDLVYDDGSRTFFIVEPSATLRRLDSESWEPDHALVRAVQGLKKGERFVGPEGRAGVVQQIRHKYVARLHYVMEHYESRFPEITGFRRIAVDFGQTGGLEALTAEVKERSDWIQEEESQYLNSPMPIGVLAHRVGADTIEVGAGLALSGARLKVAAGNEQERDAAFRAVRSNSRRGCVLDLLAYWTAWRLGALETLRATCGPIHLPQSLLDRLRARRERLSYNVRDGLRMGGYDNGKILLQEVSADVIVAQRDEVDRAIAWAQDNATISPVVAGDDLHPLVREHLRMGRPDIFDGIVLAQKAGVLLVTDDLPTREFDRLLGGGRSAWLHVVFGVALDWKHTDTNCYIRYTADLIEAGHGYLGVSGAILAQAAQLDAIDGQAPGRLFRAASLMIGGRLAEPASHIEVVVDCLRSLWRASDTIRFREPVTSHLLRQLVRERTADYVPILRVVLINVRDMSELRDYLWCWLHGHFLAHEVLRPRERPSY